MTVEPRFGTGPRPGGTLGEQLLQGQMDQQKALGRLEAGIKFKIPRRVHPAGGSLS